MELWGLVESKGTERTRQQQWMTKLRVSRVRSFRFSYLHLMMQSITDMLRQTFSITSPSHS